MSISIICSNGSRSTLTLVQYCNTGTAHHYLMPYDLLATVQNIQQQIVLND